jgi:CheY-like chemotaxis protein
MKVTPQMAQNTLPAALLLIVATEPALRLRLEWLERAGYRVRTACSLKEVDQACQAQIFDVVLIADSVEPRMKKAIGLAVRHHLPEAPILQMGRVRPDIDGNSFVTGDSREGVLQSVSKILLRRDEIRPAAI